MMELDTIPKVILQLCHTHGDKKVAMRQKNYGIWWEYSFLDVYETIKYFCLGLVSLGLETDDKIAIIGDNDIHWHLSAIAAMSAGAAVAGIWTDSLPTEIKYIVEHSDSKFVVANDQEQVDKFLLLKDELPLLKKAVYWDPKGLKNYDDPILISFDKVTELGRKYEESHSEDFQQLVDRGKGGDIALLTYTSGTTGLPKGTMVRHKTLINNYQQVGKKIILSDMDRYVSIATPAWIGEQMFFTMALSSGVKVHYPEEPETADKDAREVGPSMLFYSSRLWESLSSMVLSKITDAGFVKRFVYYLLLPIGYKLYQLEQKGGKPNLFWQVLNGIANGVLFRQLRDKLGLSYGRLVITAGALISPDTFAYMRAIGIKLRQTYGGTEVAMVTLQNSDDIRPESVGVVLPGVRLRIADDGEILVGEDVFLGYYKNPEATNEVLKGKYFRTGDAGYIDDDGHLIYLDRLDDLKELAGGHRYAPQYIESRLRFSPYIRDALVIGRKENTYVTALVSIDFENVGRWAESHAIPYTTFVDLSQRPEICDIVRKEIQKVNRILPEPSRVLKFANLHKEFDADEAELTRTRKIRRGFMEERYHDLISAIYGDKTELDVESMVTYRDGRKGTIEAAIKINPVE